MSRLIATTFAVYLPKLPALVQYQLSLQTPAPPNGNVNRAAARRGEALFMGDAGCATCHKPPLYTDVASGTTPLRALWQHAPYFHDGSAADLLDVVNRYNNDPRFALGLTERQKADLVEFLKTL